MSRRSLSPDGITPELMLRAYSIGVFPMAESAHDPWLHWIEPRQRGIIPLDRLHISRSLQKLIRADQFEIRINADFNAMVEACANARETTWISHRLRSLYGALHEQGFAHSVEAYFNNELVGGLFGITLGGAFFGESMFHRKTDASKVALAHLVARLIKGRFRLLDTQFITPHLASLGATEIDRTTYLSYLDQALINEADFFAFDESNAHQGEEVLTILNEVKTNPLD
jgi:leucyl/phenylalanyl-tRNA--protein transferase